EQVHGRLLAGDEARGGRAALPAGRANQAL
ncbi:MAG: hypothetical protein AVDCRST_MAG68-1676, partial [uncultured Gemmatimonadetes bacterium]